MLCSTALPLQPAARAQHQRRQPRATVIAAALPQEARSQQPLVAAAVSGCLAAAAALLLNVAHPGAVEAKELVQGALQLKWRWPFNAWRAFAALLGSPPPTALAPAVEAAPTAAPALSTELHLPARLGVNALLMPRCRLPPRGGWRHPGL